MIRVHPAMLRAVSSALQSFQSRSTAASMGLAPINHAKNEISTANNLIIALPIVSGRRRLSLPNSKAQCQAGTREGAKNYPRMDVASEGQATNRSEG